MSSAASFPPASSADASTVSSTSSDPAFSVSCCEFSSPDASSAVSSASDAPSSLLDSGCSATSPDVSSDAAPVSSYCSVSVAGSLDASSAITLVGKLLKSIITVHSIAMYLLSCFFIVLFPLILSGFQCEIHDSLGDPLLAGLIPGLVHFCLVFAVLRGLSYPQIKRKKSILCPLVSLYTKSLGKATLNVLNFHNIC